MSGPPADKRYSALRSGGMLLSIPTLLIVSPLVGFFIGSWLERRFHFAPWGSILGLVLGLVAAARETWKIYQRYLAEEQETKGR